MAVRRVMNKLKTRLITNENNLEELKAVALELDSFFKTNTILKPQGVSPKGIYDELCLLPGDPDYTEGAREIKLHHYKEELLKIISGIIESAKASKATVAEPHQNVPPKVRENRLKIMVQMFKHFKIEAFGRGDLAVRLTFYIVLFFITCVCLSVIKPPVSLPHTDDDKIIVETLAKGYKSKFAFYSKRIISLKKEIRKETNTIRKEALLKELRVTENKIDILTSAILPDLDPEKNNIMDSARRSRIDSYKKELPNF